MPNRSLDDFAGGDDEAADDSDSVDTVASAADPEPTGAATSADEPATADDVDGTSDSDDADGRDVSTLATYRWTPEATACPQCGESVRKRWLDGDEYVCLDCKDW
ncbi:hypothetical protein C5B91_08000 [Haloferax sp. Atlit-10N]|uniref:DUF7573 domain-containing protein n=1 Tax=unclassified Haloferax TaxID=2625095 RepID=UPI000E237FD3|nr:MULTISPECIES: zinc ribbon domain-containing protein [unclassified Haloferax]RDZ45059.1 hypothetical protein C5B87_12970 [Haloferax sp. Atlit-16N]RDZ48411.1 hypothetical protein C5B86_05035 [Haloferax sp. Atlit-19N]RDZ59164.1 hypothetical protein C5B91_08000 [Haloferax sp. Atlit-10N]